MAKDATAITFTTFIRYWRDGLKNYGFLEKKTYKNPSLPSGKHPCLINPPNHPDSSHQNNVSVPYGNCPMDQ
jgi:hypothetical protein